MKAASSGVGEGRRVTGCGRGWGRGWGGGGRGPGAGVMSQAGVIRSGCKCAGIRELPPSPGFHCDPRTVALEEKKWLGLVTHA